ncbi:PLP-dependent aminotransferase family protein [Trinickia sp. NRRL B-1857]|uniref:MocR-like pyridoxine biosynthesis transcription factor PdxR n=1 Tax=Trinickia sp. NRRL B-1857 TaxID=3162879 RepID=UPI003D2BEE4F
MELQINIEGRRTLAAQIYRQLREGILDGRLAGGQRLPSTRDLASQLRVSRKTTLEVFERLISEGYLHARAGDGTFVTDGLMRAQADARSTNDIHAQAAPHSSAVRTLWTETPLALSMPTRLAPLDCDFLGGVTDKSVFPFDAWRRCFNHALRDQARSRADYRDPGGEQALRLAISRYVAFSRALDCTWQDAIVTQGAQQALDLLARVVIRPGDIVAVEDPGYPPARTAFAAAGAKIVGIPVDADGIVVAQLPKKARLVYVTPSHQFPLGMPMTLARRVALLEWARRCGAVVVEDDYDGEFRFDGRPMESLKSLDSAGLVAYVGTFSKTIFPELRIGYVIAPRGLNAALLKAKQACDWHTCTLTQTALARFMLDGHFARHLRRVHKRYDVRRAMLIDHLQHRLAPWFEPIVPAAGIHLSALLKTGIDEKSLIEAARERSIGLYGIGDFHMGEPGRPGLLFGYGGVSEEQIEQGLNQLAVLLEGKANGRGTVKRKARAPRI